MKIKQITTMNVKGIPNNVFNMSEKLTVFTGPNGSGKTSLLEVLETLLTKSKFANVDTFIKNGEKKAEMSIVMADAYGADHTIQLSKTPASGISFKLDGEKSNFEKVQQWISLNCGVTEKNGIVKYADISTMKPKELAEYIARYIPQAYSKAEILAMKKESYSAKTYGIEEEVAYTSDDIVAASALLSSLLPDTVTKDSIQALQERTKQELAMVKKNLGYYMGEIAKIPDSMARSLDIVQAEKEQLIAQNNNCAIINQAWQAYEANVSSYNQYMTDLQTMYNEIQEMKVDENIESEIGKVQDLLSSWRDYRSKMNQSLGLNEQQLSLLQISIDKLNTQVCPLSEKLLCTTDKTPIRDELSQQISELSKNTESIKGMIADADSKINTLSSQMSILNDARILKAKKDSMVKQYEMLYKNIPAVPVQPTTPKVDPEAIQTKLQNINAELIAANNQEVKKSLLLKLDQCKTEYHKWNFLSQWIDDKGEIMKGMMDKYLSKLNALVAERAKAAYPNWNITFTFDNGLVPMVEISGKNTAMPYSALSAGEKAITDLFICDLLNRLSEGQMTDANGNVYPTGFRTLLIDGLEKLDKQNYLAFLNALNTTIAPDYDNIIINLVNHSDLVSTNIQCNHFAF